VLVVVQSYVTIAALAGATVAADDNRAATTRAARETFILHKLPMYEQARRCS
jgi:hypothetical protein